MGIHVGKDAPGAEPCGTAMEKINSRPEDGHRDGARCTVIGSISTGHVDPDVPVSYFVEWDDMKGIAVFIAGDRLRPVTS